MRTYKCDRCGTQFAVSGPHDPPASMTSDPRELGLTIKMPIRHEARIGMVEVDLCGPCVARLVQWMGWIQDPKDPESPKAAIVFLIDLLKRRGIESGCDPEDYDGGSYADDLRGLAKHFGIDLL